MKKYFENLARALLGMKYGDLNQSEQNVIESIANKEPIATDLNESFSEQLTFGERVADKVAEFGGSWTFIILFSSVMATWMVVNVVVLTADEAFDPYPFILLNLALSALAAFQAPIIMMSQNRQASKDRMAASLNYEVSLKTDLEIMRLNQKLDDVLNQIESKQDPKTDDLNGE